MIECVMFGGLLLDKYFEIDGLPQRGQDEFVKNEFSCVGGCCINMAATFNNLGGTAHVVSYIGKDKSGDQILEYMDEHKFSKRYVSQKEGQTGYCMVFLEPDGERTFLTKPGMEMEFSKEVLRDGLEGINYAAVTGYFLLNPGAEELVKCLEEFHERGGYILFDPSPLVGSVDKEILKRIIHISNAITPNESELKVLRSAETNTEENSSGEEAAAKWIKDNVAKGKMMVVKSGNLGGKVYTSQGTSSYGAVINQVVDTTGAGDSFAGGLIYGIAAGLELGRAISLGTHTAAVTVGINGPHGFWEPNAFMRRILKGKEKCQGKEF